MSAVILLAKLGLFALSAAGWCLLLNRWMGLRAEFAPIVAFSAIGSAMVAAGLLNIFTPVEWALYLGGLGCAVSVGLKDKAEALILQKDRSREEYYNYFTFGNWGVASTYDLCVDSSILGIEGTADFIIDFARRSGLL